MDSKNDLAKPPRSPRPERTEQTSRELPGRATFSGPGPRKSLVPVMRPKTSILFPLCRQAFSIQSSAVILNSDSWLLTSISEGYQGEALASYLAAFSAAPPTSSEDRSVRVPIKSLGSKARARLATISKALDTLVYFE